MISHALRMDIENWVAKKAENPMFELAAAGSLTKAMITRYIANVTYMIRNTPTHLRRARDVAMKRHDEKLASYFSQKVSEEEGHVVWGEADLESLRRMVVAPSTTTITPSIEALAAFLTETIDRDPTLYLGYIVFAEYITVMLAPELLALIEQRCGVPKTSMTVIDNHVELDREHAEEGFAIIDDLVTDPRKLGPMRSALTVCIRLFDAFCGEITTTTAIVAADESSKQVSAA